MPTPPVVINDRQWLTAIDEEIDRLKQVRNLLAGTDRTATRKPTRTLSAAARARISAAQKKRWAQQKRAAK
jgi:hypothetical protein